MEDSEQSRYPLTSIVKSLLGQVHSVVRDVERLQADIR